MTAPGPPLHLVRRFFGSLRARRPGAEGQLFVARTLTPELARLFWDQPVTDQAHGIAAARRIGSAAPERRDLVQAALLHDVGKRHARLGVIGRSLASVAAMVRMPVRGRHARYLAHGDAGAAELERAGASPIAVAFARHHHGTRPDTITPDDWKLLLEADDE